MNSTEAIAVIMCKSGKIYRTICHRRVDNSIQSGVFCFDEIKPCDVNISEGPCVSERCPCRFRANGCGVIRIGIERRV